MTRGTRWALARERIDATPRSVKALALLLFLSPLLVLPYLRGDGNGYYAWARSPVIDGDLHFENEFLRGDPTFLAAVTDEDGELRADMVLPNGRVRNQWSVGPALLWAPAFVAGHVVVLAGQAVGVGWASDGYALPYLWVTAFVTALSASVGVWLAFGISRRVARLGPAVLGTAAVWLASSLPIYQYLLPFWPFGIAVLASAALLRVWVLEGWGARRWLIIGVLAGFGTIVHPVAAAWVALPVASLLGLDRASRRERLRALPWFTIGGLLGVMPQLVLKGLVNGSPFDTGYQVQWRFLRPDILGTLFGADHGLFSWTPVLALAAAGLFLVRRHDRRLGTGLLIVFGVMLYLVAAYGSYEQSSFGNRFFVCFTPGFVVGAAALADSLWTRRRAIVAIGAALIVWNALFMFQWAWGLVPKRGAVDWPVMVRQQFTEAPSEMVRAVRLFFTDRGELIRIVEANDIENLGSGDG